MPAPFHAQTPITINRKKKTLPCGATAAASRKAYKTFANTTRSRLDFPPTPAYYSSEEEQCPTDRALSAACPVPSFAVALLACRCGEEIFSPIHPTIATAATPSPYNNHCEERTKVALAPHFPKSTRSSVPYSRSFRIELDLEILLLPATLDRAAGRQRIVMQMQGDFIIPSPFPVVTVWPTVMRVSLRPAPQH